MFSGLTSALSEFRNIRPSKRHTAQLTVGIAAATLAAVAGLTAGSASAAAPKPVAGATQHLHTASHIAASQARTSQAGTSHTGTSQAGTSQAGTSHTGASPAGRHPGAAAPGSASRVVLADKAAPAHRSHPQAASQHPAAQAQPYYFYDSVTPWEIPANQQVATYANGDYAVSPSEVAGRGQVLWIDVSGDDIGATALDVEPGDATPTIAANWALDKLRAQPDSVALIYTMRSEWPAVQTAVADTVPSRMWPNIRWWIADPTGVPHLVPGSSATQYYWGPDYDINLAAPGLLTAQDDQPATPSPQPVKAAAQTRPAGQTRRAAQSASYASSAWAHHYLERGDVGFFGADGFGGGVQAS